MKHMIVSKTTVMFLVTVIIFSVVGISFGTGNSYGELKDENEDLTDEPEIDILSGADIVINYANAPDWIHETDDLEVEYEIENIGDETDEESYVDLIIDGSVKDFDSSIELAPGETHQGTLIYDDVEEDYNEGETIPWTVELWDFDDSESGQTEVVSYHIINDWHDLSSMSEDLDADYTLMDDLDEDTDGYSDHVDTEDGWEPIGEDGEEFTGTFDGNGHTISDLYIDRPTEEHVGLFGYTDNSEIGNIDLVELDVTGEQRVGGLVGYNDGLVTQSSASGSVEAADGWYTGVLIGYNGFSGEVISSYSSGVVEGSSGLGGLSGINQNVITDSYSTADVIATGNFIGGLVGEQRDEVKNSYSTGEVSGDSWVGGLIGQDQGDVEDSFWDTETSGQDTSDGDETGKTTEEIKDVATFTDLNTEGLEEPWDFVGNPNDDEGDEETWSIDDEQEVNDGYPILSWQAVTYEITDWEELYYIRFDLDGDYTLMNDLDSETDGYDEYVDTNDGWDPIGEQFNSFEGTFDGNGHEISDLYIDRPGENNIGLFGRIEGSTIEKLKVSGEVSGDQWVGGLVGYSTFGDTMIENTVVNVDVTGNDRVGGLVGVTHDGNLIRNSASRGSITGPNDANLGGLVGRIHTPDVIIENTYAVGPVNQGESGDDIGGLIGFKHADAQVLNSFWDVDTTGQDTSAGGTGKTTEEMKDVATFTDLSTEGLEEPWDFVGNPNDDEGDEDIWNIDENTNDGYPILFWESLSIYDWFDLDAIRDHPDGNYVLMNDLDENTDGYDELVDTGDGWEPIGEVGAEFTGSFDGNGHEISDLYIDRPGQGRVGLFGRTDGDVTIENLKVSGEVSGNQWVGGLVGLIGGGDVTINNVISEVDVTGSDRVGGLVGIAHNGNRIIDSAARGPVDGPDEANIGGLIGRIHHGDVIIENTYAVGSVNQGESGDDVGGLVGFKHADAQVLNSFWDVDTTGQDASDGGTGVSTADMMVESTFTDAGWDLTIPGTWAMAGYPHLQFERTTEITDLAELQLIKVDIDDDYTLMNDIDASETSIWNDGSGFDPIGDDPDHFTGSFDGNGHTIENLYIDRENEEYVGLFGFAEGGVIQDVTLEEVSIDGLRLVGGLVGWLEDGTAEGITVSGEVYGTSFSIGGVSGVLSNATIADSTASVDVEGQSAEVGGLVGAAVYGSSIINGVVEGTVSGNGQLAGGILGGSNFGSNAIENSSSSVSVDNENNNGAGGLAGIMYSSEDIVRNSFATGDVSGEDRIGGLLGYIAGTVINSYATGSVNGNEYVGGLVGYNDGGEIDKSYAAGSVTGNGETGGLVGLNEGDVTNSFWDTETSGQDTSDGGTGKTTAEMQNSETFTNTDTEGLDEPWDIEIIAGPDLEDDYPYLSWEVGNSPVWYIEQTSYAASFDVSVDDIQAGDEPIIEIFDAVDQFDDPLEGDYDVNIWTEIDDESVILSFENGEADHTWEAMTEAADFTAEVIIDGVTESDTFTVNPGDVDTVNISPVDGQTTVSAGEDLSFNAEAFDEYDNLITDEITDFDWDNAEDGVFNEESAGDLDVTATYDGVSSDPVTITVVAGDLDYIEISPQDSTIDAGDSETYTAVAYDEYGNEIGDVTDDTDWDIDTEAGGNWDDNVYTSENAGTWTVTGTYEGETDEATLVVEMDEPEFIPENLVLDVDPLEGEMPLEVTIYVSGENAGEEAGSIDVIVDGTVEYTLNIPAGDSADHEFTYTFDEEGIYQIEFHDLTETVNVGDVPEFIPEDLVLDVTPTFGEPPLEVTIYVSGENTGDEAGSIDVIVDGTVEYTLDIPAEDSADHTFTHTFAELGTYHIEFHDLTETVDVIDPTGFAPVNQELEVDPISGEVPLTVDISVQAENIGEETGSIDVIVDGTVEYTLNLPAGDSADHTFTHTFDEAGEYDIEFGELVETVTVDPKVETHTLSVTVDGDGSVDVDPELDEYEEGTEVTITAEPEEGYEFVEWTGDYPEGQRESETITLVINDEFSLTANFQQIDDTPTDDEDPAPTDILSDYWWLLAVVIIGAVIGVALAVMKAKKKPSDGGSYQEQPLQDQQEYQEQPPQNQYPENDQNPNAEEAFDKKENQLEQPSEELNQDRYQDE